MENNPLIVSLRKPLDSSNPAQHPAMIVSMQKAKTAEKPPLVPSNLTSELSRTRVSRPAERRQRKLLPIFLAIIIALLIGVAGFGIYWSFTSGTKSTTKNVSHISEQDIQQLVSQVGALIALPQGETPTVATVTDLNALKGQAFFANATLGDKVLMYPKAGQAILFNPTTNKIMQVGPLTVTP